MRRDLSPAEYPGSNLGVPLLQCLAMHFEDAQEWLSIAIHSGSADWQAEGYADRREVDALACEVWDAQQSEDASKKELLSSLLEYVRQQHVRRLMQTT